MLSARIQSSGEALKDPAATIVRGVSEFVRPAVLVVIWHYEDAIDIIVQLYDP